MVRSVVCLLHFCHEGFVFIDALWNGQPGAPGSIAWRPDSQQCRTHFWDAGLVCLLQSKDPAVGISSTTMRAGKQHRRRPAKVFLRAPAAAPEAGEIVEAEDFHAYDGKIIPAYRDSSPEYKRWVRRHTSSRFGNVPRAVLDAERSLSAVSVKGASLQDRLAYVSLFAKVGYGRGCHALHCDTRRMAVCVCVRVAASCG